MKLSRIVLVVILMCALLVGGVSALLKTTIIDGAYTVDIYTNVTGIVGNTTWTPPMGTTSASILIVGGGGSAGSSYAGAGGGGGFLERSISGIDGPVSIIVGDGGVAPTGSNNGNNGLNSQFGWGSTEGIDNFVAYGGGYGGKDAVSGGSGGSGGGGGNNPTSGGSATQNLSASGGYGNNGGGNSGAAGVAGGGGASQSGFSNAVNDTITGGDGGDGRESSITGTATYYAGGGGGGGRTDFSGKAYGVGGLGGGGDGGTSGSYGHDGTDGFGGGGGAAGTTGSPTGKGGSGIVIVRYVTPPLVASFTATNISIATNTTASGWEGISPFTMQFINTSTSPPHTSWVWNYTELSAPLTPVTFNSTTYYNPIYTFTNAGNYSISLNVTGTYGTNISTQITWINVSSGATKPIAMSSLSRLAIQAGSYVWFNDTSLNTPTAYCWTFWDGTFAATANGSKTYYKRGIFNTSSNVSNSAGFNLSYNIIRVV